MSTSDNDTVRRLVYGGSTKSGSLSTADIAWFVASNPNVYLAAAAAAQAEARAITRSGSLKVGDLEIDYGTGGGQTSAGWMELSRQLRLQGVRRVAPYAGGISVADKTANESDTDRVAPAFKVGQFDYEPVEEST